jgi:hypothetical protein
MEIPDNSHSLYVFNSKRIPLRCNLVLGFLTHVLTLTFPGFITVMAPTPEVGYLLRRIWDKWDKLEDGKYFALLSGIVVIFGFVASLA